MVLTHKVSGERYRGILQRVRIITAIASYDVYYVKLTQIDGIKSDFREYPTQLYKDYK